MDGVGDTCAEPPLPGERVRDRPDVDVVDRDDGISSPIFRFFFLSPLGAYVNVK